MTTAKTALQEQVGYYTALEGSLSSGNTSSLDSLTKGVSDLSSNLSKLYSSSKELENGAKSLYDGVNTLSTGVNTLHNGSSEMKNGLASLSDGTSKLYIANTQLSDGAKTMADGASTLSDGMSRFNKEGIGVIANAINSDLKDVSSRLEKLQDLANEYNNFTMLSDGNQGTAKFIMVMDGIHKEDSSKETAVTNEDKRNDNEVLEEERE